MGIPEVGFRHPLVMRGAIAIPPDKLLIDSLPALGNGAVLKDLLNLNLLRTIHHESFRRWLTPPALIVLVQQ